MDSKYDENNVAVKPDFHAVTPDGHLNLRAETMDSEYQENEVPDAYDRSVPTAKSLK